MTRADASGRRGPRGGTAVAARSLTWPTAEAGAATRAPPRAFSPPPPLLSPPLSRSCRVRSDQAHVKSKRKINKRERSTQEARAKNIRAEPWSRGRRRGLRAAGATRLRLGEVVELVHGLLEAPLRVGADVPTSASAGGHRGGAGRGIGGGDGDGGGDACFQAAAAECCLVPDIYTQEGVHGKRAASGPDER